MPRVLRENRNHSVPIHLPEHSDWQIELSLLERSDIYSVHSDNPNWLHENKRMPTLHNGCDNSTLDLDSVNCNISFSSGINTSENSSIESFDENTVLKSQDYVLIVLYTTTTLLAIFGNSLAIIIFTKGKRSKTDLRPFLINLAVADLIMAIFCIPFTFTYQLLGSNWIFSKPMCPIVMFLQTVSVTGSVSTNIAIGIDRFSAIAFPLNTSRNKPLRYRLIILVIWFIATTFAGVQLFVGDTRYNNVTKHIDCYENWPKMEMGLVYTILLLFLTYLIPVVILTFTYSIVGYLLWKRNLPGNADAHRDQAQLKSKLKILKMLVTIVVLFALCWLPLHTFFLVLNFSTGLPDYTLLSLPYFICHWIAMSNSFVNPIVYGFLNDSFRADLKALMSRLCHLRSSTSSANRHGALKFKYRSGTYSMNYTSPVHAEKYTNKAYLNVKYGNQSRIIRNGSGSSSGSYSRNETLSSNLLRSATK